jgi:hypothetical protein
MVLLVGLAHTEAFHLSMAPHPNPYRARHPVTMKMEFANLRKTVLPSDGKDTLRNMLGGQPFLFGVYTLVAPTNAMSAVAGLACSGSSLMLARGLAMTHLLLGAKMCKESDESDTAATALALYGGWAVILQGGLASGIGGHATRTALCWCVGMALIAVRRLGLSASGLVFVTSWSALLQSVLGVKALAAPLVPFLFSTDSKAGTKPKAKASAKPAAKGTANPAKTKPAAKPAAQPKVPAPPGYKYDAWGRLSVV